MRGAGIVVRTPSTPNISDKFGNVWQYNSRSDHHSKVACWAVLFDLLQTSDLLQRHVRAGRVTFGMNRQLNDWETGKKKNLDLVVARTPGPGSPAAGPSADLQTLAEQYRIDLTAEEWDALAQLPAGGTAIAGSTVLVALEAKACMTAHVRALPRLYDELSSSHSIVHGNNPTALSVGLVMINVADSFISADRNRRPLNAEDPPESSKHTQPHAAERVLSKIRELRRRSGPGTGGGGFDALGALVVDMKNDGSSPVRILTGPPAPRANDSYHYDQMVVRAAHLYDSTFGHVQ